LAAGVYVTLAVQLPAAQLGVPIAPSVPCVGAVPIANVNAALSMSVPAKVTASAVFFAVVTLWALETGASFTAVIVRLTVDAAEVRLPSLDVTVKLSGPL
jgi:hypothetical protein